MWQVQKSPSTRLLLIEGLNDLLEKRSPSSFPQWRLYGTEVFLWPQQRSVADVDVMSICSLNALKTCDVNWDVLLEMMSLGKPKWRNSHEHIREGLMGSLKTCKRRQITGFRELNTTGTGTLCWLVWGCRESDSEPTVYSRRCSPQWWMVEKDLVDGGSALWFVNPGETGDLMSCHLWSIFRSYVTFILILDAVQNHTVFLLYSSTWCLVFYLRCLEDRLFYSGKGWWKQSMQGVYWVKGNVFVAWFNPGSVPDSIWSEWHGLLPHP